MIISCGCLKISLSKKSDAEYDFDKWTVRQLREFANKNNIKIPSKSNKKDIVALFKEVVSNPDFVDRSQEKELNEELIAEFEEDQSDIIHQKEKTELKFWQKPPYSSLLDPELAKDSDVAFYDLYSLVEKFFDNMLREELINYKISGIALKTSSVLHHYKISSIIAEEEEIQKKEELEKFRTTHYRSIPKALPQPVQPKMQIATKEELFDAMRSAIIEAMQKKEKLKRMRMKKEEIKQQRIQIKSKAQLPRELLKHISGREQTIEELHDSWFNRIKAMIDINNREITFFELMDIIKNDEKSSIGRRFALVRLFLALMFLSSGNKVVLSQEEEFKNLSINLR